jgi:hypothetical protein
VKLFYSLFLVCAFAAAPKEKIMEWKGQFGGVSAAGHRLINDEEGWKKLWSEVGQPAPAVDLKTQVAVAVFLGPQRTGGWRISWEKPSHRKGRAILRYKIEPPQGFAIQALTQPWAVHLFPRTAEKIAVEIKR